MPVRGDKKGQGAANFEIGAFKKGERSATGRGAEQSNPGSEQFGRGAEQSNRGSDRAGDGLERAGQGSERSVGGSARAGRGTERVDRVSDQLAAGSGKLELSVLREGAKDKQVGLAQRSLNTLGYEGCKPDGKFGPKTTETVRSFQGDHGLAKDGVVGNRETWPAMTKALTTRHEGLTLLGEAMGANRPVSEPMGRELKQLNMILGEFSGGTEVRVRDEALLPTLNNRVAGEMVYVNRGSESLADVSRLFGIPVQVLIASNPDIEKPYLILPGQEIVIPNMIRERDHRKPPRQLHPADPDGYLASSSMNPDFVSRINGMIAQLRGEGYDIRVTAGFRTFSEQQKRFEQGRTASGSIVTDLQAGQSWHNYGLAVDIALNDDDGNPVWPEDSSLFWQRLGDVALAQGAVWGGAFGHPDHIEYHPDFGRQEAVCFIEDFEGYGLNAVWDRIALAIPPDA